MAYRILIIKLAALGDVVRTTFLLPCLKKARHESEIYWVTGKNALEILGNNTLIKRALAIEDADRLPKRFDLVLSLDDEENAARLASKVDKKRLIGAYFQSGVRYTPDSEAWFGMGLLRPVREGGLKTANLLKKANRKTYQEIIAGIAGVKYRKETPSINLSKKEVAFGVNFVKNNKLSHPIVGINTGAGSRWQLKKWSVDKTVSLANKLNEAGASVILLGGREERERNARIKMLLGFKPADAGTANTLRRFASVINACDIIVTSDTLAMQTAIALKKKVVVLIGPTSSAEIEIYGRGKKITAGMDCLCCYKKRCSIRPSCMDNISVNMVFSAVRRLL